MVRCEENRNFMKVSFKNDLTDVTDDLPELVNMVSSEETRDRHGDIDGFRIKIHNV